MEYIDETVIKDTNPINGFFTNSNSKISNVYLLDNMKGMKQFPDGYFDLGVVDPPYGIGASSKKFINGTSKSKKKYYKENCWDESIPSKNYFDELFRVSKNQIIWGGNYFTDFLKPSRCWIFWDKTIHGNSYADGELAWTSFDEVIRYYRKNICQVELEGDRIHPTQKTIHLYDWIYKNYLPEGGKVIDTHLGSQSNRISAFKAGNIDFWAFENDIDYFNEGNLRFKKFVSQGNLF